MKMDKGKRRMKNSKINFKKEIKNKSVLVGELYVTLHNPLPKYDK